MINIVTISKEESKELNKMGYQFHKDIMPTYTRHRHYFLIETNKSLNDLRKLRQKNVVFSAK